LLSVLTHSVQKNDFQWSNIDFHFVKNNIEIKPIKVGIEFRETYVFL